MKLFIRTAWCGCLLSGALCTLPSDHTSAVVLDRDSALPATDKCDKLAMEVDPSISSLMQVSADVRQVAKNRPSRHLPASPNAKHSTWEIPANGKAVTTGAGAFGNVRSLVPRPVALALVALETKLERQGFSGTTMIVVMAMMVITPLMVMVIFSVFLLKGPNMEKRAPGKEKDLQKAREQEENSRRTDRKMPAFSDANKSTDDAQHRGAANSVKERTVATRADTSQSQPQEANTGPLYDGGSFGSNGLSSFVETVRYHARAMTGLQAYKEPEVNSQGGQKVLQPSLIVEQPNGLMLHLEGNKILPTPQQSIMKLYMNYGTASSQLILQALISEDDRHGDKGVQIQSAQHFPVAFLDTTRAVGKVHPPKRNVRIFDHVPDKTSADAAAVSEAYYLCIQAVENMQSCFEVFPVTNGLPGKSWYQFRVVGECINVVDMLGRLQASVEVRSGDGANYKNYVMQVATGNDASLMVAGAIAVFKLGSVTHIDGVL